MKPTLLIATGLTLFTLATPAYAVMCYGQDDAPGVQISVGIRIGEPFTELENNEHDAMRLRQAGVDATRVERWNGCLRAYVRKPGGGEEMQFFEPGSLIRVE